MSEHGGYDYGLFVRSDGRYRVWLPRTAAVASILRRAFAAWEEVMRT